ncbi:MAG: Sporulation kinase E [Syntrophorhabdus sp. PtaU1.Bin002]|nr:MAG: Sporulation kinase E [Syntrophorhabdus sp. PtaB.Bin006]OPY69369.1 MAG: Sporulation kinase E [Syntrophorhabdus sp. PtaU1.Bin002]
MKDTVKSKQQPTEPSQELVESGDRSVANVLIDSMTLINRTYVYEFASEAYCRDHGRSKKEIVGNPVAEIWGEATFKKVIKKHLDQCFTGNVVRYDNWLEVPGREARCYRVSYSPYFNGSGQITHAMVASQDITDLKREEESIEKSEPGFKAILKNMHYGVFTFDVEGRFTYVNDVVVKRSGYPRKWYAEKSLFDVVWPQDRERVQEHFKATVRGEQVSPYEFSFKKAADEVAWAQISTTPIRNGGSVVGVLGVIMDITKRIKFEQALIESEKKYRTLFEDSRDAIFITDKEGLLTDVNRSFLKLFGYTKEETKGLRAIDTYVNREDCKRYMKAIEEQGFVEDFKAKLKKKNGKIMVCLLNGTPLRTHDGTIQGYQGIARDERYKKS